MIIHLCLAEHVPLGLRRCGRFVFKSSDGCSLPSERSRSSLVMAAALVLLHRTCWFC